MNVSPHKKNVEAMRAEIARDIAPSRMSVDEFVKKVQKNDINEIENVVHQFLKSGINKKVVAVTLNTANVLLTLENVPEVYIRTKIMDILLPETKQLFTNTPTKEDYANFVLPFSEFVITFEKRDGDKYSEVFYSVFELAERYIVEGRQYPIYVIKEMWWYDKAKSDPGLTTTDFMVIPPLLPRLYIACKQAANCPNSVTANPLLKSTEANSSKNVVMCQKTFRTMHQCAFGVVEHMVIDKTKMKETLGPIGNFIPMPTVPERCFDDLCKVIVILKRMAKAGSKPVYKVSQSANRTATEHAKTEREPAGERIIYLTENSYRYISAEPGQRKSLGYERERPREHVRQGHYRRLRNGKLLYVPGKVINKGHKKPAKFIL